MQNTLPIYQVSDLVNQMRRLMEASYPEIWIEGELSSLSTPASGHLYFSLKDSQSQLRCAMFRPRASINKYKPKAGDLVKVRAKISVYPARGDLQCIVQYIEEAGEGLLQRRYEELKNKLNNAGLFNVNDKQTLPNFAKRIGIITSPSGAAVRDILSTLQRRCPGIPVTIYPAVVQGDTAAKSIIQAINDACQHQICDVLLLSRGGGSLEDLWCFNDESLAYAIHRCPIPIVSGVGHEIDITIADLVADMRAPTPTAAAELLSPDNSALLQQLNTLSLRLYNAAQRKYHQQAQTVDFQYQRLVHPKQQLINKTRQLQQLHVRLIRQSQQVIIQSKTGLKHIEQRFRSHQPHQNINTQKQQLQQLGQRLNTMSQSHHQRLTDKINALGKQLHTVSPLATLERGFSVVRDASQEVMPIIRSSHQLQLQQSVNIKLASGHATCKVEKLDHAD